MRISPTQQNISFNAKINPKLLERAERYVKSDMQKNFLAKRIKEIEQYGDKNTIISCENRMSRTTGITLSLTGENNCLPKRRNSPRTTFTPLYVAENCAFCNYNYDANAYDVITMITPERVYDCEKKFFVDSIKDNKLDAKKELERCQSIVAPDTYKAFQEGAEAIDNGIRVPYY